MDEHERHLMSGFFKKGEKHLKLEVLIENNSKKKSPVIIPFDI